MDKKTNVLELEQDTSKMVGQDHT